MYEVMSRLGETVVHMMIVYWWIHWTTTSEKIDYAINTCLLLRAIALDHRIFLE